MPLDLADYKTKARLAVKTYWADMPKTNKGKPSTGKAKRKEQEIVGNMTAFIDLIRDLVRANGLPDAEIILKNRLLTLPGHFHPAKLWDLLVMNQGRLIAAIELKSLVGEQLGKIIESSNAETISLAVDYWAVRRNWAFGENLRPFVGHLCLLEDSPATCAPVKDTTLLFPMDPKYRNASYAQRYNIFCKKLIMEGLYSNASVILASRKASRSGRYSEMSKLTGLTPFVAGLASRAAAEAIT